MKKKYLLSLFIVLFFQVILFAEDKIVDAAEETIKFQIRIDSVLSQDFPGIKAYVSVENLEGEPDSSLVKGNFSAKIDTEDPLTTIEVDPFKYLEEPVHFVFLLSASGLMEGKPMAAQKEGVLSFSEQIREIDTMSAFVLSDKIQELFSYAPASEIPAETIQEITISENPVKIFDTLVNVGRKIEKDRNDLLIPKDERVVFVLISDGRDQDSRFTMQQTVDILSEAGLPVFCIGLKVLSAGSLFVLNDLSNKTGGFYIFTKTPDLIDPHLQQFFSQIMTAYVLNFRVKGIKADDSYHQLMIQVDSKDSSAQAFRNFKAVKNPFPRWLKITIIAAVILLIILLIVLSLISRIKLRKSLGIGKRRCPDCKRRMKDDWEFCPFCRYLPPKKKHRKKDEE